MDQKERIPRGDDPQDAETFASVSDVQDTPAHERGSRQAPASQEQIARMGEASPARLLFEFSLPAILGMLVNGAYNLIDSIFLGQGVGELGLSTITVATPIMTVYISLALLVGNGGNAVAALRLGAGRHDQAELALGNTIILSLIVSLSMAILACSPAIEGLLALSSATPEVWDHARIFIQIISVGYVFQMLSLGLNNFIRTSGAPNRALLTMLVGALACTAFNYLFVLVLDGGVVGSACATVLGQALSFACVLWYFIRPQKAPLQIRLSFLRPDRKMVGAIVSLGMASFVVELGFALINFATNYLLVRWGHTSPLGAEQALASIGVVQRVTMFTILPLIGLAVAVQPLLGYNYGAGLYGRVRALMRDAIVSTIVLGSLMWLVVHIWPSQIVSVFGITDPDLLAFTIFALQVNLFALPLIGYQVLSANYFQAIGQPVTSIFLSLTREILFLMPLLFGLPYLMPYVTQRFTSLDAIYFAAPLADMLSIVVTTWFIAREFSRTRKLEAKLLHSQ